MSSTNKEKLPRQDIWELLAWLRKHPPPIPPPYHAAEFERIISEIASVFGPSPLPWNQSAGPIPLPWIQKSIKINLKDVVAHEVLFNAENGDTAVRVPLKGDARVQANIGLRPQTS